MFEWTRHGEDTFILTRKDKRFGDLARIDWTGRSWIVEIMGHKVVALVDPVSARARAEMNLAAEFHEMREALDDM